jgi:hypothetical protein
MFSSMPVLFTDIIYMLDSPAHIKCSYATTILDKVTVACSVILMVVIELVLVTVLQLFYLLLICLL